MYITKKFSHDEIYAICMTTVDVSVLDNCQNLRNSWAGLSRNPAAIKMVEYNLDKIYWHHVSSNPAAMHIIERMPNNIDWYSLCKNPAAVNFLQLQLRHHKYLWIASNPQIITLFQGLFQTIHKPWHEIWRSYLNLTNITTHNTFCDWKLLFHMSCSNPTLLHLMCNYSDYYNLYYNFTDESQLENTEISKNPTLVSFLEFNPKYISWPFICQNAAALHIILNNEPKFDNLYIESNPLVLWFIEAGIQTDAKKITSNAHAIPFCIHKKFPSLPSLNIIHSELMKEQFRSANLMRFDDWGY